MDRIDLNIEVAAPSMAELRSDKPEEFGCQAQPHAHRR
jgi:hypothetical protein